ncbi:DUF605-domain-containing protein [Suhomyces tanzawaensis NRRL Y-17324]|uniref:DUF605-domain-containing protein n=1 Tax=Suhomyces tanzawaensis NRRL Y-17324 TaxID=984487 RepID=A0A1E4SEJ3_9ASCO|nr:DUF605-domain-containing protein [Suhomyces tanzawaensis NRRL Y-17324]ODV77941.1 DUF605-domain-containing protein [Suhomyces tanzawaensis NRRL Y-17324]
MSITLSSIPEELKSNKSVAPYIARATELQSVNAVVSYYCKIYVLEHILSNKLHTTSKEVERFTIELLDETESIKNSNEDEGVNKALNDKAISASIVLSFAYKLFNSCLEGISQYSRTTNKAALVGKFRATLVFLSLLDVFVQNPEVDWEKLSGGKATTGSEFEALNKEKIKVLKYQLSRLLKDEVEFKDANDDELEDELNKELADLEVGEGDQSDQLEDAKEEPTPDTAPELPSAPTTLHNASSDALVLPSARTDLHSDDASPVLPSAPKDLDAPQLPSAPKDLDAPQLPSAPKHIGTSGPDESLPSAPHFLPDEDAEVKLPGAPKYLPDDDLSHINKSSSIQVFPPEKKEEAPQELVRRGPPAPGSRNTTSHHQVTKQDVSSIIDRTELIAKIQKHAKFAVSALNYEDIETAEKEMAQGLALLQRLKSQAQ